MSKIPKYKTLLYASDLGSHTRPVFRHATGLARQYQARIVMLHVVEPIGLTAETARQVVLHASAPVLVVPNLGK